MEILFQSVMECNLAGLMFCAVICLFVEEIPPLPQPLHPRSLIACPWKTMGKEDDPAPFRWISNPWPLKTIFKILKRFKKWVVATKNRNFIQIKLNQVFHTKNVDYKNASMESYPPNSKLPWNHGFILIWVSVPHIKRNWALPWTSFQSTWRGNSFRHLPVPNLEDHPTVLK